MKQVNDERGRVERLHGLLTEQLQRRRPAGATGRVTVAEIYQELVPYRTVRQELGFEETEQYERALLRLLAGEGDLAQLEPPEAREEIRRELRSSFPNVTRYREYAACDVVVRPPRAAVSASPTRAKDPVPWYVAETADDEGQPAAESPAMAEEFPDISLFALAEEPAGSGRAAVPVAEESTAEEEEDLARPQQASSHTDEPEVIGPERMDARSARCAYCDSSLPSQRAVRYCPYCGADQTTKPCGECGEAVEPNWVFCIACGAPVHA